MTDRHAMWMPLVRALAVVIVLAGLVTGTLVVMQSCQRAAMRTGDDALALGSKLMDAMIEKLHMRPVVKIDRETVYGSSRETLELQVLKNDFSHAHDWEQTWWGSTKALRIKGIFTAIYGVDLKDAFSFTINSKDLSVDVNYPKPELLSIEKVRHEIVDEDNGWWNRLTKEERENAENDLLLGAKRQAASHVELLNQVEESLRTRITEIIKASGGKVGTFNGVPTSSNFQTQDSRNN